MSSVCACRTVRESDWEGARLSLNLRSFYSRPIRLFFHLPMNLEAQAGSLLAEVGMKDYRLVKPTFLLREDGAFRGNLLVEIEKPRFFDPQILTFDERELYCVVSTRPWGQLGADVLRARTALESVSGRRAERVFLWHTTCPRCCDLKGYQTVVMVLPEEVRPA